MQLIVAYFPQARRHNESRVSAWQRRSPEELRLRNFRMLRAADKFLAQAIVLPVQCRSHFFTVRRKNFEPIFSLHRERVASHLVCPPPIEVLSRP